MTKILFTEKVQAETESTPLNWSACVFSEFLTHPFSGSSLKYISLYMTNANRSILPCGDKRKVSSPPLRRVPGTHVAVDNLFKLSEQHQISIIPRVIWAFPINNTRLVRPLHALQTHFICPYCCNIAKVK